MKKYAIGAALLLAACQPATAPSTTETAKPEAAAPIAVAADLAPVTPATPNGPPAPLQSESEENAGAYVTEVRFIKDTDAKIFSTAGGDPAMNGLYTYLAVYNEDERGWTTFMLGDFNEWKVVEEDAAKVVLEVSRSWMDGNDIKTATEKMIVAIPASGATSTTVTPAT